MKRSDSQENITELEETPHKLICFTNDPRMYFIKYSLLFYSFPFNRTFQYYPRPKIKATQGTFVLKLKFCDSNFDKVFQKIPETPFAAYSVAENSEILENRRASDEM